MAVEGGGGATVGSRADGASRAILFAGAAPAPSFAACWRAGSPARDDVACQTKTLQPPASTPKTSDTGTTKGAEREAPCARKLPICPPSHKEVGLTTCPIFWCPLRCW